MSGMELPLSIYQDNTFEGFSAESDHDEADHASYLLATGLQEAMIASLKIKNSESDDDNDYDYEDED